VFLLIADSAALFSKRFNFLFQFIDSFHFYRVQFKVARPLDVHGFFQELFSLGFQLFYGVTLQKSEHGNKTIMGVIGLQVRVF
jgi:hypothetical protein